MTAFREEIKFFSALAHGCANQFLAVVITFGGVDHVQTGVERAVQKFGDSLRCGMLITDLRSSETEDRNIHVGLTKATLFHHFMLCCSGVCVKRRTTKKALGTSASTTSKG